MAHAAYLSTADPPTYGESVEKTPSGCDTPVAHDVESSPPAYDDIECGSQEGPSGTTKTTTTTTTTTRSAAEVQQLVTVFHIVSIVCALLSILITPLIEIIPAVFCVIILVDLRNASDVNNWLNIADFIVVLVCLLIWLALIIAIAVFTFGIGLVLLIFCIPYLIVLGALGAGFGGFFLNKN